MSEITINDNWVTVEANKFTFGTLRTNSITIGDNLMRFESDGRIYYQNRLLITDQEIVDALRNLFLGKTE